MSMTISTLLADYRAGKRTPSGMLESSLARADEGAYACAWIHQVDASVLMRRAKELEDRVGKIPAPCKACRCTVCPIAVKDNIDVAGLPTTAALPRVLLCGEALSQRGGKAGGRRRYRC